MLTAHALAISKELGIIQISEAVLHRRKEMFI